MYLVAKIRFDIAENELRKESCVPANVRKTEGYAASRRRSLPYRQPTVPPEQQRLSAAQAATPRRSLDSSAEREILAMVGTNPYEIEKSKGIFYQG